ncbi:MAG TPA: diacylglycerol kinase family protein [Candidatus Limnocylindria bacterium]
MATPSAPVLVLNPISGDGAGGRLVPTLEAQLGRRNASLQVSTRRGHCEELAAEAIRDGADRVVAVGGDGTMQEVVNGIISAGGGTLGVVPIGRGNDLARSLGIPIDVLPALDIALGPATRTMDVGRAIRDATLRHFVAAGGVGFDAQVSWTMSNPRPWWKNGRMGYFAGTLDELRRFHNQRLRITFDQATGQEPVDHTSLMVAFANGPFYGGGMKICPDASLSDGQLDVCVVGDLSRFEAMRELPGLYEAKHVNNPKVRFYRTRWILIEGDEPTRVHLDGEPWGTLPIRVEALPAALQVAVAA